MTNKEAIKILLNSQIYLARHCGKTDMYNAVDLAIKALEDRPQGEWIFNTTWQDYECNTCHEWTRKRQSELPNYCPNCGAYMEGIKHDNRT